MSKTHGIMMSINPSEKEHKWSKNSLDEIVRRVASLGKVNGYMLNVWCTRFDSHDGFVVCGSHIFAVTHVVRYVVARDFARQLFKLKDVTTSNNVHASMFHKCGSMDMNPDGIAFYPSSKMTPADNAKLVAEYIFGVLVQDALLKATLTQLVNSSVLETVHPKTLLKLRQDGYLLNSPDSIKKLAQKLDHRSVLDNGDVLY